MHKLLVTLLLPMVLLTQASMIWAGELKTVTLGVEGITCNMCPITVKKALKNVEGVTEVVAKYEGKGNGWTRVTFDTNKTSVKDLTLATEQAGYPSKLNP